MSNEFERARVEADEKQAAYEQVRREHDAAYDAARRATAQKSAPEAQESY